MRKLSVSGSVLTLAVAIAGCGDHSGDGEADQDSVRLLKTYWADARKLNLTDLIRVETGYAAERLNDKLAVGEFAATFEAPSVFGAQEQRSEILDEIAGASNRVRSLSAIVSGLAAQFGDSELSTQVNAIRLKQVQSGGNSKYYIESGFSLKGGIDHGWSFSAGGFGGSLGFAAQAILSSRVIVASDDQRLRSLVTAPLHAVKEMRGFIYPRSVADVRAMRPGEMFALKGEGRLGVNLGVGVPLLAAAPIPQASYDVVFSAGVSASLTGDLDVQLVRLEGDEVVVDVGMETVKETSFEAAIKDGWGIKAVCDDGSPCLRTIDLGLKKVDLKRMTEQAVQRRLDEYLHTEIGGGVSSVKSRAMVSRMRFHLDRGDATEVSRALEQALKADVRLAQALHNRDLGNPTPAVAVDFDLLRNATTSKRNFGAQIFGMSIYQKVVVEKSGVFSVDTPSGSQLLLFDSLDKHGGWFQMDHGFTRIGVAALAFEKSEPDVSKSQANLFVQTLVGDTHMDDDTMIDNADALISALAGSAAVEALDTYGNALQRKVWDTCPVEEDDNHQTKPWDEQCNVKLLDDPEMQRLKANGMAAIESKISSLPEDYKDMVRTAAHVRLTLQSVGIHNLDALNGPSASFTLDFHLDDKALMLLASKKPEEYRSALVDYLTAVSADRIHVGKDTDKAAVKAAVLEKYGSAIEAMSKVYERRSKEYAELAKLDSNIAAVLGGKRYIAHPIGIRATTDGFALQSISHERSLTAQALFDDLKDTASRKFTRAPLYEEHAAAYPLLALLPAPSIELSLDVKTDVKSNFWVSRERFKKAGFAGVVKAAKGADVAMISGGMFDVRAIVNAR